MKYLFLILVAFVLSFFSVAFNGYVLSKLWLWFIVPLFNLPNLTIPYAIGISLVVRFLTYTDTSDLKKENNDSDGWKLLKGFIVAFIGPLFALIIGKVVLQFI